MTNMTTNKNHHISTTIPRGSKIDNEPSTLSEARLGDVAWVYARGNFRTGRIVKIGRKNITVEYVTKGGIEDAARRQANIRAKVAQGRDVFMQGHDEGDWADRCWNDLVEWAGEPDWKPTVSKKATAEFWLDRTLAAATPEAPEVPQVDDNAARELKGAHSRVGISAATVARFEEWAETERTGQDLRDFNKDRLEAVKRLARAVRFLEETLQSLG